MPLAMPVTVRGSEATERWEDFTPSHGREIFVFIRRSLKTALSCTLNAIMGKLCEVAARICQQLGSKVRERSDGAGKGVEGGHGCRSRGMGDISPQYIRWGWPVQCVPIKRKPILSVRYFHFHGRLKQAICTIIKSIFSSFI